MKQFNIGKVKVGEGCPVFVIAEISGNHGGDIAVAKKLIASAKSSGANAVKLQTYTADTITLNSNKPDFVIKNGPWSSYNTLYELYQKAYTPWEWHEELFNYARSLDIEIFSSPFDLTAVDFLEELNAPAYKIASPEITDIPLIKRVAQTGKPVILSTGVATLEDIELAVKTLEENNCSDFTILKCTTAYPTPFSEVNLATMSDIKKRFNCIVGISDHSIGNTVPVLSVGLGGKVIEKHISDSDIETVDSFFSLNETSFESMIKMVREAEESIGEVTYTLSSEAKKNLGGRRSLYITSDLSKGDVLTSQNVRSVRPSYGLHPKFYEKILGKKVKCNLEIGDRLRLEDIEGYE